MIRFWKSRIGPYQLRDNKGHKHLKRPSKPITVTFLPIEKACFRNHRQMVLIMRSVVDRIVYRVTQERKTVAPLH